MKNILPLYEPVFSKDMHTSTVFSIIGSHEDHLNWIYSECAMIRYQIEKSIYSLYSNQNNPLIIKKKISKIILSELQNFDIIDFLKTSINNNTYILLAINHYYIEQSIARGKNKIHSLFIYGYDDALKCLYISDHFFDKNTKYSTATCGYGEFRASYINTNCAIQTWPWGDFLLNDIELYTINHNFKYSFNLSKLYYQINDYIFKDEITDKYAYGLKCYEYLIDDLKNKEIDRFIIQNFYFLWQHKVVMIKILKYLCDINMIPNLLIIEFHNIEIQSRIMLNLLLKYRFTKKSILIDKVIDLLKCVSNDEKKILMNINEFINQKMIEVSKLDTELP